jgi:hypothetical protein
MALPKLPPPAELTNEQKKGVIDGLKKVLEAYQAAGILDSAVTYAKLVHNPELLYAFIQLYRKAPQVAETIVVGKDGHPVSAEDKPLICGVTLLQVQQLLCRTCARYFMEQDTKIDEEIVTETITKTKFLFFKSTEQVERVAGGGFDDRKVREVSRCIAYDWQLPLLPAYSSLSSAQLLELSDDIVVLQSAQAIADLAQFNQMTLKKVKEIAGADFPYILATRPAAIGGISGWNKDNYAFYRGVLGDAAFEFFSREKQFFMHCAALERPLIKIYGDVLCYIASENLEELQRLNIDKVDVMIAGMRKVFGERLRLILSRPAFAKDILRKLVEGMMHISQEKAQLLISAEITVKSIAPQVAEWLSKQPPL